MFPNATAPSAAPRPQLSKAQLASRPLLQMAASASTDKPRKPKKSRNKLLEMAEEGKGNKRRKTGNGPKTAGKSLPSLLEFM